MVWSTGFKAASQRRRRRLLPTRVRQWPRIRGMGGEFFWVCVGQIIAALGCIAGVRLLTGVMSPQPYGEFMLAMTLVTLVQQVLASPIAVAAQRFYATAQEEGTEEPYERALLSLVVRASALIAASAIAGVIFCLFIRRFSIAATIGSAALFAMLLGAGAVMDGILNAARHRVVVAWHQAATQWCRWLFALFAVLLFGTSATVAILGCCAAMLLLSVTRLAALRHCSLGLHRRGESRNHSHSQWDLRLYEYVWPFALWGVFTWAVTVSDRWALQCFATTADVGQYAVLYQLGFFPCVLLADALQQLAAPIFFQHAGSGNDTQRLHRVRAMNRYLLLIFGIIMSTTVFFLWLLHRPLLEFLAGSQFRARSSLLPWVAMAGGFFALGQLAALSIVSGRTVRSLVPVKIGSALIGIAANAIAACYWGLAGVVYAGVCTSAVYFCWTLIVARANPAERHSEPTVGMS